MSESENARLTSEVLDQWDEVADLTERGDASGPWCAILPADLRALVAAARESTPAPTDRGMTFDKPMALPVGDRFILAGKLKTRVILACEEAHRSDYSPAAVNERERAIKALIAAAQAAPAPTEALADLPATPWTWRISNDRRWCEVWSGRNNDARPVALLHDDDHADALVRLVNGLAARTGPDSEVAAREAVYNAVLAIQGHDDYATEIAGVRIEACDTYGQTTTTRDLEQTRKDVEHLQDLLRTSGSEVAPTKAEARLDIVLENVRDLMRGMERPRHPQQSIAYGFLMRAVLDAIDANRIEAGA